MTVKRQTEGYTHKAHLNMTMNTKKENRDERSKKTEPNAGYFLTADVSSVLKVINKNLKMDSSIQRKRVNMMTEEDVEKLFENDQNSNCKKKSDSKPKDYLRKDRRPPTHEIDDDPRENTHKIRFDDRSKSKDKRKGILQTDPDDVLNYSRKI